jgi:DNA-binding NarL/FixJ family response regulator
MKYNRATEILPEELLKEVQEYVEGCLIYIPSKLGLRRDWGESTSAKAITRDRNHNILCDYRSGLSVKRIALKYHLAESTVKKIVYKR